jgi:periplasmic protein TonB
MFSRLVASAGGRSQFRSPMVIGASVAAHVGLLAGVVWLSSPDHAPLAEADTSAEEVTYIDITEIPPPDMVFEEPPVEQPPQPAAAPVRQVAAPRTRPAEPRRTTPTAPARVAQPEPAGFQELQAPPTVLGIPPPDPSLAAVRAADFGGRGQAGGTGAGTPAASTGTSRVGTGATGTDTGAVSGPPTGTFTPNLVDRRVELTNRAEITRVLQRLYPSMLRDMGVEGSVQVQFVVTAEGRVDMSTVQITSATDDQFAAATRKALQEFRFRPARKGNHNVRMLTVLPVSWTLTR